MSAVSGDKQKLAFGEDDDSDVMIGENGGPQTIGTSEEASIKSTNGVIGDTPAKTAEEEDLAAYLGKKRAGGNVEGLGRTGGVYIPPFKLARLEEEERKRRGEVSKYSPEYQRAAFDAMRKSITGIINKVNLFNIPNIILELLRENLIRGRGVFARAIMRAVMASPGFTHIYTALLAVVNSKLPVIGELVLHRTILHLRRAHKRNDKINFTACARFIAHMVNQRLCDEGIILQIIAALLTEPTADAIEEVVSLLQDCGQRLLEISPRAMETKCTTLRTILHEGKVDSRVQYVVEKFFEHRRKQFADFPAILEELDLVEEDDQVTHDPDLLDDNLKAQETLNIFKPKLASEYEAEEKAWRRISNELLGEENSDNETEGKKKEGGAGDETDDDEGESGDEEEEEDEDKADDIMRRMAASQIVDQTSQDLINLRRTVYLAIMSSLNFEECVHRLLRLNVKEGQETEVCNMLIDCCAQERTYQRFFALQAERLARLKQDYQSAFQECFSKQYAMAHRLETNKLRNTAKFFAHLLYTSAISWEVFGDVELTEEATTSSTRIFLKILLQEMAENLGMTTLVQKFQTSPSAHAFTGIFPTTSMRHIRFAINFYTAIGLGGLTEGLRKHLAKLQLEQQQAAMKAEPSSSSSSESESESESESDSGSESNSDSESESASSSSSAASSDSEDKSSSRRRQRRMKRSESSSSESESSRSSGSDSSRSPSRSPSPRRSKKSSSNRPRSKRESSPIRSSRTRREDSHSKRSQEETRQHRKRESPHRRRRADSSDSNSSIRSKVTRRATENRRSSRDATRRISPEKEKKRSRKSKESSLPRGTVKSESSSRSRSRRRSRDRGGLEKKRKMRSRSGSSAISRSSDRKPHRSSRRSRRSRSSSRGDRRSD